MQKDLDSIKESGLQVVGLSYDKVEPLAKFGDKSNIKFPMLSDPESKVIRKLGILNNKFKEGTKKYGIAYPMTIIIDSEQKVAGVIPGTVAKRHDAKKLIDTWSKVNAGGGDKAEAKSALDFTMKNIDGDDVDLSRYKGKVVVMVNVASRCGMTPQYEPLQALYKEHKDAGLVVLGFPCNQFNNQEPGTNSDIKEFCTEKYGVEFDMFSKVDVNGEEAAPLFKYLTAQETKPKGAGKVDWNFEKFVVGRDGKLAGRFRTRTSPGSDDFQAFVKDLLKTEK